MTAYCPTATFVTEHAFDDFDQWFDSSESSLGSSWAMEFREDASDGLCSVRTYASPSGASIRISITKIFDSVELFGGDEVVLGIVRRLMLAHISDVLDSRFRCVVEFHGGAAGSENGAILHATFEDSLVHAALGKIAGGELVVVFGKNYPAEKILQRGRLICDSRYLFLAKISEFDAEIFEYVFGAVSDPPPFIVGVLEDEKSAQALCDSLSENLVHKESLVDSGVTNLLAPTMRFMRWGFLLNIGDKGYENGAILFVREGDSATEAALSRSFVYRASVLIGDRRSGARLLQAERKSAD